MSAPPRNRLEVLAAYPGATAEPLPEPHRRPATAAEAAELRRLIRQVLADAPHEWDEVERIACADAEAALPGWRELAGESAGGAFSVADDRRYCADCAHLAARPDRDGARRCYAGERGDLAHGSRRYYPVTEFPRRCEAYRPLPGDPDQRTGAERWPGLSDDSARQEYGR